MTIRVTERSTWVARAAFTKAIVDTLSDEEAGLSLAVQNLHNDGDASDGKALRVFADELAEKLVATAVRTLRASTKRAGKP